MKTLGLKQTTEKATKFLLSLVDNKKNLEILYFSLLALSTLTLFLGFQWSVYVIWWLLGFGWSMFFFRKNINLLERKSKYIKILIKKENLPDCVPRQKQTPDQKIQGLSLAFLHIHLLSSRLYCWYRNF